MSEPQLTDEESRVLFGMVGASVWHVPGSAEGSPTCRRLHDLGLAKPAWPTHEGAGRYPTPPMYRPTRSGVDYVLSRRLSG